MPLLPGAQVAAARIRLCHEVQPRFQPARCPWRPVRVERANYILRVRAVEAGCEAYMAEVAGSTRMPTRKVRWRKPWQTLRISCLRSVRGMPSAPLNNAVKQLGTMIAKGLDEAGLAHGEVRVISSPRRLAALVANVATATDEVHEVKRGPRPTLPSTLTVTPPRPPGLCPQVRCGCRGPGPPRGH